MTDTATLDAPAKPRKPPMAMNGVNTPALLATIDAVAGHRELAKFQFRANGQWMVGTHMRGTMLGFSGAGGEHTHKAAVEAHSDHPAVLCGEDNGPTPVEWLLHGLAGCLTAGIANIASARGVVLSKVECSVVGDIDLQGILGLSDEVRNGFGAIRVNFRIEGDAPAEKLAQIVEQARARSAVFDALTNGCPVDVVVER